MSFARRFARIALAAALAVATAAPASAQQTGAAPASPAPFEPQVGQPGKDVVWVPSPEATVERMLDLAKVTPADFVVDLGSGDGRNVIAAARRGARALGVEFNPDMVALSQRNAAAAGVADRAQFVQGDMFLADFSKATVLALFLLPSNMQQLRDKFLALAPGSRIVANTFGIEDWTPDATVTIDNCTSWCTAMLFVVPAQLAGNWKTPEGLLVLEQKYQMLSGTLTAGGTSTPVTGRLDGRAVSLTIGTRQVSARADGGRLDGTVSSDGRSTPWTATR